jgi:molecular chaperone DnaK
VSRIQLASDDLERSMQRVGQEIYSQPGTAGDNGATGSTSNAGPEEPGTVEGEYREV